MLIDKIRAFLPFTAFSEQDWLKMQQLTDRIQRICPRTGEVQWETNVWSSERSDTHTLSYRVAGDGLWVSGSPARCIGDGCAVFGSGASSALDLVGCLRAMWTFFEGFAGLDAPPSFEPSQWKITAADVTDNLLLGSLQEVHEVLDILRGVEGGRYKVSSQAGQTVYWSHRSILRAAKAYAKGPHLRWMQKQRGYTGREYSETELLAAERLVRLELMLRRDWFKRNGNWWELTADDLRKEWAEYFERMTGDKVIKSERELTKRVLELADTEGRGRAAIGCWGVIQSVGYTSAQAFYSKTTWHRHLRLLRKAGLSDGDLSHGQVIPVVFKVHECRRVSGWDELLRVA